VKKIFQRDRLEHGVPDADHETQRRQRLFDQLRTKLLDLSRKNPMLNYRHRVGSRRQLRIVDCDLETVLAELGGKQAEHPIEALPEPDDLPDDERTAGFLAALGQAKAMDLEYLTPSTIASKKTTPIPLTLQYGTHD